MYHSVDQLVESTLCILLDRSKNNLSHSNCGQTLSLTRLVAHRGTLITVPFWRGLVQSAAERCACEKMYSLLLYLLAAIAFSGGLHGGTFAGLKLFQLLASCLVFKQ